jgi:hypothetical protein
MAEEEGMDIGATRSLNTNTSTPSTSTPSTSTSGINIVEAFLATVPYKKDDIEIQITKKKSVLRKLKAQQTKQETKVKEEIQKLKSIRSKVLAEQISLVTLKHELTTAEDLQNVL